MEWLAEDEWKLKSKLSGWMGLPLPIPTPHPHLKNMCRNKTKEFPCVLCGWGRGVEVKVTLPRFFAFKSVKTAMLMGHLEIPSRFPLFQVLYLRISYNAPLEAKLA